MGIGNKLFKLKKFFTIEETARRLSLVLDEEVSNADILELAYDRHITMSVIIEDNMFGILAKLKTTTYRAILNINDDGSYKSLFGNIEYMPTQFIDAEQEKIERIGNIFTIPYGCYDLPMKWAESLDILWMYQQEKSKSPKEWINMEGVFLCYGDHFINVMNPFENKKIDWDYTKERKKILMNKETKEPITKNNYSDYFYPAGGLIYANGSQDIEFVFRRENIEKFEQLLLENTQEIDYEKSQLLMASTLKILKESNPKKWTQGELSDLISEQAWFKGLGKRRIDAYFSQCNKLLDASIKK